MTASIIPIYVLTGFLGSGKTTLLSRMIEDFKAKGLKPAVVMNELGDVNLDGIIVGQDIPMEEIIGGCICCTVKGDLGLALHQLVEQNRPDVILIESTGAANPLEMIDAVTEVSLYQKVELKHIITVLDVKALSDLIHKGKGKTYRLMKEQTRCGTLLLLNKTDVLATEESLAVQDKIKQWNPKSPLFLTTRCEIDINDLISHKINISEMNYKVHEEHIRHHHSHEHNHHRQEHSHHTHEHVMALTYYFEHAIDSSEFEAFLKQLPDDIYRAKGVVRFSDTASLYLFQYAYKQVEFIAIDPQGSVPSVAVFIGEHFSKEELELQLKQM
jgi:G3E family GTPase